MKLNYLNKLWKEYQADPTDYNYNKLYFPLKLYLTNFLHKYYSNMRTLTTQAVDSTMIAIFLSSQQYDPTRSSFITWCSSIAKNQILQLYKGRNKELAFDMQTHEKFHFIPQSEDDSELQMKRQVEALIEFLEEDTDPMAKLMLAKFNGQQYITNEDGNHLKYNSLKTKIRAYKKKIRLHFKNNVLFNNII